MDAAHCQACAFLRLRPEVNALPHLQSPFLGAVAGLGSEADVAYAADVREPPLPDQLQFIADARAIRYDRVILAARKSRRPQTAGESQSVQARRCESSVRWMVCSDELPRDE
jgi:hypothetical protein